MGWLTAVEVSGDSMLPALRAGDWLIVRKGGRPRLSDLVVAQHPQEDRLIVKRLVHRVPEGWWLESDNQRGSRDSWLFGAVPEELIVGRVIARYWPPRRLTLRPGKRPSRR